MSVLTTYFIGLSPCAVEASQPANYLHVLGGPSTTDHNAYNEFRVFARR